MPLRPAGQRLKSAFTLISRIESGHYPTLDLVGSANYFNSDGGLGGIATDTKVGDGQIGLKLEEGGFRD